jgi:cyclopropane fatty-acyl-phospholipid synthase-like methyltransferase
VAGLRDGETVLDLGSGGGGRTTDVIISNCVINLSSDKATMPEAKTPCFPS